METNSPSLHQTQGGSLHIKENTPFGVGRTGAATIELIKDRKGRVSRYQNEHRVVAKLQLASDPSGCVTASLVPPLPSDDGTSLDSYMRKISQALSANPGGLNQSELCSKVGGDRSATVRAATKLKDGGFIKIERSSGRGNALMHTLVKPYPSD